MSHEYAQDGSIAVHHDRCSWAAVHGKEAPSPEPWDRSWTFLCCCDVIQGVESEIRALTLDAVREAVAAVPHGISGDTGLHIHRERALAAINALREERSDD